MGAGRMGAASRGIVGVRLRRTLIARLSGMSVPVSVSVPPSVSVLTGGEENGPDYQEGKTDRPQNADEHRHHLDSLNHLYPLMACSMQRATGFEPQR